MKPGSVIVDVAIDQGGSVETSRARPRTPNRPTSSTASCITWSPTCRAPCPARRPTRSTTRPCRSRLQIANKGWRKALHDDPHLKNGLNVAAGKVTYKAVAKALNLPYAPADSVLPL